MQAGERPLRTLPGSQLHVTSAQERPCMPHALQASGTPPTLPGTQTRKLSCSPAWWAHDSRPFSACPACSLQLLESGVEACPALAWPSGAEPAPISGLGCSHPAAAALTSDVELLISFVFIFLSVFDRSVTTWGMTCPMTFWALSTQTSSASTSPGRELPSLEQACLTCPEARQLQGQSLPGRISSSCCSAAEGLGGPGRGHGRPCPLLSASVWRSQLASSGVRCGSLLLTVRSRARGPPPLLPACLQVLPLVSAQPPAEPGF